MRNTFPVFNNNCNNKVRIHINRLSHLNSNISLYKYIFSFIHYKQVINSYEYMYAVYYENINFIDYISTVAVPAVLELGSGSFCWIVSTTGVGSLLSFFQHLQSQGRWLAKYAIKDLSIFPRKFHKLFQKTKWTHDFS